MADLGYRFEKVGGLMGAPRLRTPATQLQSDYAFLIMRDNISPTSIGVPEDVMNYTQESSHAPEYYRQGVRMFNSLLAENPIFTPKDILCASYPSCDDGEETTKAITSMLLDKIIPNSFLYLNEDKGKWPHEFTNGYCDGWPDYFIKGLLRIEEITKPLYYFPEGHREVISAVFKFCKEQAGQTSTPLAVGGQLLKELLTDEYDMFDELVDGVLDSDNRITEDMVYSLIEHVSTIPVTSPFHEEPVRRFSDPNLEWARIMFNAYIQISGLAGCYDHQDVVLLATGQM
jgi:hypothetical protein